ncbi:MAG: 1-acyl-sn-glycerol-3-phosphate acyltransferase [Clostridia bacterium]|nr:1-acyl-sn-glycerol-3-phosphate acyltransferase [Clostridia bacterium]
MKLGRFLIRTLGPLIRVCMRVQVVGKENIPTTPGDPPLVLCSNHISNWDPVLLVVAQPRHIYFMAKSELFGNRLFAWLLGKQFGAFPVKRGTGDTGAIDTAKQLVSEGKLMGIFPEGTRSKDGKLLRAKSGASLIVAQTGAHVLPVAIVAKGQKVRPFKPTTLIVGKPLSPAELHVDDPAAPDLRFATRKIMGTIAAMMEEYQ